MSFSSKGCVVVVCLGMLCSPAWGGKNVGKAVKGLTPKSSQKITDLYFPPYRMAGYLQEAVARRSRQALLTGLTLSNARLERKKTKAVLSPVNSKPHIAQTQLSKPGMSEILYAQEQTQFLRDYLKENQNKWPVYREDDPQQNRILRRIMGLMEADDTSAQILALKREIILLRATSVAHSPREIESIVRDMLRYGVVPLRAWVGVDQRHVEEEMALGEEMAFAMLARRVPMENNPWDFADMAETADKVATYNAMRRADPLFEGIPTTYTGANGLQENNIPVMDSATYEIRQKVFAQAHPFIYVLAGYWEKNFGQAFFRIFNHLSPVEKQAVLLNAPKLPQSVDTQSPAFDTYYNRALTRWTKENGKKPSPHIAPEQEGLLTDFLRAAQPAKKLFVFKNNEGFWTEFADLPYQEQEEILLWAWQAGVPPHQVLQRLGKCQKFF